MDFSQLSMFLTLAECRQFSEAAEKEHISQSSLSKQIKALEEEVGAKLFSRSARGTELTSVGREFYTFAQTSLEAKRHMQLRISAHIELQNKSTTVGVMPVMASYGMVELFAGFQRDYPQFRLSIAEKGTEDILRLLAEDAFKLALIGVGMCDPEQYTEYPLLRDEILLAVAADHPLATGPAVDLRRLQDEPFILMEHSVGLNRIVLDGCKAAGFIPNISYVCNIVPSALSMVKEGLGVFLFTSRGINIFDTAGIALVGLRDKLYGEVVLVTSKKQALNQADTVFRDFTLNWYRDLNQREGRGAPG